MASFSPCIWNIQYSYLKKIGFIHLKKIFQYITQIYFVISSKAKGKIHEVENLEYSNTQTSTNALFVNPQKSPSWNAEIVQRSALQPSDYVIY